MLSDIDERIILVKNCELFDSSLLAIIKDKAKVVISGNVDQCYSKNKEQILSKDWKTKIFFSALESDTRYQVPQLQKYQGYMLGNKNGVVGINKT